MATINRYGDRYAPRIPRMQCGVQHDKTTGVIHVYSKPVPIHRAEIRHQGGTVWEITFPTLAARKVIKPTVEKALEEAGRIIGYSAGRDFQSFSASQRYAMGQQKCPYTPGGMRAKGDPRELAKRLCNQPANVGTVWCEHHPGGEEVQ
jgi:hypothetical protein